MSEQRYPRGITDRSHGTLAPLGAPGNLQLKTPVLLVLVVIGWFSGCAWFHHGARPAPDPTELIVTGVAKGSVLYIDGAQAGPPMESNSRTRVLEIAPGSHVVEVRMGDTVVYREDTYAGPGDKRVITVLSGNSRD